MSGFLFGLGLAFWFGILTSISPCPLATNIAAISFIGRRLDKPRLVLMTGLLYTLGRAIAYIAVSALIVKSLLSAPVLSHFLQKHMFRFLGPVLVITGMFLLELIRSGGRVPGPGERVRERAEKMGIWGGGLLGVVFALSFCPLSAVLFFGSLIPLAVEYNSTFLIPFSFGVGTAIPVVVFAVVISTGARYLGRTFDCITTIDLWARRVTGVLFIGLGIWFTLKYVFLLF